MHVHDDTEQVFYILRGTGTLYIGKDGGQHFAVRAGQVVRIPPHTYHRILSGRKQQMAYLSVDCFVGGRPKQEPTWDSHVQVMCRQQRWELNKVRGSGKKRRRVRQHFCRPLGSKSEPDTSRTP